MSALDEAARKLVAWADSRIGRPYGTYWSPAAAESDWNEGKARLDALRAALDEHDETCGMCGHWASFGGDRGHCSWLSEKTFESEHRCADDHWTPREGESR